MPGLLSFPFVESVCSVFHQFLQLTSQRTQRVLQVFSRSVPVGLLFALFAVFLGGCGSAMNTPPAPPPGPASVTVLLSSTANDQLSEFFFTISTITLTNKAGVAVTLFNNPTPPGPGQPNEFIHLNGGLEPLVTVSVPAGVYDSAALTFVTPVFSHITADSTGALTIHFDEDNHGTESATVNLPSPITVSGAAMTLVLNLQVSPSVSFSTAVNGDTFTITPTFTLSPLSISPQPTSVQNGEVPGIQGQVSAISTANNSFTVQTPNFETLTFQTGTNTVFQGIGAFSALTTGMDLILDAGIQSNGSLQATRVAVRDVTALNVVTGPIVVQGLDPSGSGLTFVDVLNTQHLTNDVNNQPANTERYDLESNTTFRTAEQFTNIAGLPFPASFSAAGLFLGQSIYVSSAGISSHTPATTITLMPQTINGTISSISSSGNFQIYTVALAPYDLLTTLGTATQVTVYVDSNTKTLNSTTLALGSPFRFNGLLFNDNGTLRMDCGQINDGVTE
jgi:hypothetical protein